MSLWGHDFGLPIQNILIATRNTKTISAQTTHTPRRCVASTPRSQPATNRANCRIAKFQDSWHTRNRDSPASPAPKVHADASKLMPKPKQSPVRSNQLTCFSFLRPPTLAPDPWSAVARIIAAGHNTLDQAASPRKLTPEPAQPASWTSRPSRARRSGLPAAPSRAAILRATCRTGLWLESP